MIKILANDGINKAGLNMLLNAGFEVDTQKIEQNNLASEIEKYDVLIVRSATKVNKEIIEAGKNLKIIGRGGVGLDNIDIDYAKLKNIAVINTPSSSSISVAELVFAHLLSGCRFMNYSNQELVKNPNQNFNEVKKKTSAGIELFGKTLGIIGFGRIGQEVARIAIAMGMNILAYDPYFESKTIKIVFNISLNIEPINVNIKMVPLESLLTNSDFLTLHVPGGLGYVLGKKEFELIKKGAGLVNCSRGGTIDEEAMTENLKNGKLAFAGIDVFVKEPPEYNEFIGLPNVSLTAHVGASTLEAQERIGIELATHIINHFKN